MRIFSFEFLQSKNSWICCGRRPAGPAAPENNVLPFSLL
jgi:hypothetical protein